MDEEDLKREGGEVNTADIPQEEIVSQTPNRDKLRGMLSEEIPDYNMDDDEAASEQLMGYINSGRDQRSRMAEALRQDPRLAQVLSDVASGKSGAGAAFARYFGKDALMAEEGTPEYDEIIAAEEERKKEMESFDCSKKEYEANIEKSMPVLEQWCQSKGVNMDEFMDSIWEKVIGPVMAGIYSAEMLDLLDKGINYDKDTMDAMAAGEVKGRNQNINKMREESGDGLPKGMATVAQPQEQAPKKKRNSFIESALGA